MRLCFLDACELGDGLLRGAALVTDQRTRPVEFRVTDPVRCTPMQRALYGAVLGEHVAIDLIGGPLLAALRESPSYVLVRDQRWLVLQTAVARPVFWIGPDEESDDPDAIVMGFHGSGVDVDAARTALREVAARYSLLEPFERMGAAVRGVHGQGAGALT